MLELRIRTTRRTEARDITDEVMELVTGKEGSLLHLFSTHTTCGLLINEDADPDVMTDLLEAFERLAPRDFGYAHAEGNSDAHIKSSLTGHSLAIPFHEGKPVLGTWQGIYLMEFDGPRERRITVTLV
jgi:secondary thiamine-phosphate synthase enzyme